MKMLKLALLILLCVFCPVARGITPQVTVSASAVTLLGGNQTISITLTLIDPNNTGMLKVLPNIVPPGKASTVTPGTTATCGPVFGNDVILDGYGNPSTTYYKIQVFLVSNGIIASTPSLQNFYQLAGSGTVDLSTATPLAPSFFTGPSGNVSMPGNLSVTGSTTLAAPVIAPSIGPTSGQQHTLPAVASDTFGLLAAPQTFTNKTFDISANTLKSSSNTAGHVPRNNGTQYVDGQLAAADLSTPLQGTDANLLTSGTVSASTGVALCTDANHGATTSGCTPGGVSESFLSFAGAGAGTGGIAEQTFLKTLTPSAHTLTRFTVAVVVQGVTCATAPVVALWDATAGSALTSLTIANSTAFFDSGVISVAVTAGHQIDTKVTTANSGCGTQPTLGNMVATVQ